MLGKAASRCEQIRAVAIPTEQKSGTSANFRLALSTAQPTKPLDTTTTSIATPTKID